MYPSVEKLAQPILNKKVVKIAFNAYALWFAFEDGTCVKYAVYGDCCSHSYFYDFYGVKKLLENGPIISMNPVDLGPETWSEKRDYTKYYGYAFVTEHPVFGEMTSVVSFRNDSNGYYGGEMYLSTDAKICDFPSKLITSDVIEAEGVL